MAAGLIIRLLACIMIAATVLTEATRPILVVDISQRAQIPVAGGGGEREQRGNRRKHEAGDPSRGGGGGGGHAGHAETPVVHAHMRK